MALASVTAAVVVSDPRGPFESLLAVPAATHLVAPASSLHPGFRRAPTGKRFWVSVDLCGRSTSMSSIVRAFGAPFGSPTGPLGRSVRGTLSLLQAVGRPELFDLFSGGLVVGQDVGHRLSQGVQLPLSRLGVSPLLVFE